MKSEKTHPLTKLAKETVEGYVRKKDCPSPRNCHRR